MLFSDFFSLLTFFLLATLTSASGANSHLTEVFSIDEVAYYKFSKAISFTLNAAEDLALVASSEGLYIFRIDTVGTNVSPLDLRTGSVDYVIAYYPTPVFQVKLAQSEHYAIISTENGLEVLDLTTIGSVGAATDLTGTNIASNGTGVRVTSICVDDANQLVYYSDAHGYFEAVDVSGLDDYDGVNTIDLAGLVVASSQDNWEYMWDLKLSPNGDLLALSTSGYFALYDVSVLGTPGSPVSFFDVHLGGASYYTYSVSWSSDQQLLYAGTEVGLKVLDLSGGIVSNLTTLEIAEFRENSSYSDMFMIAANIVDQLCVYAEGYRGLRVLDVTVLGDIGNVLDLKNDGYNSEIGVYSDAKEYGQSAVLSQDRTTAYLLYETSGLRILKLEPFDNFDVQLNPPLESLAKKGMVAYYDIASSPGLKVNPQSTACFVLDNTYELGIVGITALGTIENPRDLQNDGNFVIGGYVPGNEVESFGFYPTPAENVIISEDADYLSVFYSGDLGTPGNPNMINWGDHGVSYIYLPSVPNYTSSWYFDSGSTHDAKFIWTANRDVFFMFSTDSMGFQSDNTNDLVASYQATSQIRDIAFSNDGKYVFICDTSALVIDITSLVHGMTPVDLNDYVIAWFYQVDQFYGGDDAASFARPNPTDTRLYVLHNSNTIRVVDITTLGTVGAPVDISNQYVAFYEFVVNLHFILVHPEGTRLFVLGGGTYVIDITPEGTTSTPLDLHYGGVDYIVDYYDSTAATISFNSNGSLVFEAEDTYGFKALDFSQAGYVNNAITIKLSAEPSLQVGLEYEFLLSVFGDHDVFGHWMKLQSGIDFSFSAPQIVIDGEVQGERSWVNLISEQSRLVLLPDIEAIEDASPQGTLDIAIAITVETQEFYHLLKFPITASLQMDFSSGLVIDTPAQTLLVMLSIRDPAWSDKIDFILGDSGALAISFDKNLRSLMAFGPLEHMNLALRNLRFALKPEFSALVIDPLTILLSLEIEDYINETLKINHDTVDDTSLNLSLLKPNNSPSVNITKRLQDQVDDSISEGTTEAKIEAQFVFRFAEDSFEDIDGDILEYSATWIDGGVERTLSELDWITFENRDRRFVGIIPSVYGASSTPVQITIRVTADDSYSTTNEEFTLSFFNQGPTVVKSIDNYVVHVGDQLSYIIDATVFADQDSPSLSLTVSLPGGVDLPNWLTFESSQGRLHGIPRPEDLTGSYPIEIEIEIVADDRFKTVATTFKLVITNYVPKSVDIPDITVEVGVIFDFQLPDDAFVDVDDANQLVFSAHMKLDDGSLTTLPSWLSFDPNSRQFYGEPTANDIAYDTTEGKFNQDFSFQVMAQDPAGAVTAEYFTLTYENYSPVQVVPLPAQRVHLGENLDFIFASGTFTDVEHAKQSKDLSYSAKQADGSSLPDWLKFDNGTRRFYGRRTVDEAIIGNETETVNVLVTASDGFTSVDGPLEIEVYNNVPTVNSQLADIDLVLGKDFVTTFPGTAFKDPDGDILEWSASLVVDKDTLEPLPLWLGFEGQNLRGNPSAQDVAYDSALKLYREVFTIRIQATDLGGLKSHQDIELTVENSSPYLVKELQKQFDDEYAHAEIFIEEEFTFAFSPDSFKDNEGDNLTFEALIRDGSIWKPLSLDDWIKFDSSTRQFSGTPAQEHLYEDFKIKVVASDGLNQDEDFFVIKVEKLPLLYIVRIITAILGPLIGLLGLVKYRSNIYNLCCQRKYKYSKEIAIVGQVYEMKIFLVEEDLNVCDEAIRQLKKRAKMDKVGRPWYLEYSPDNPNIDAIYRQAIVEVVSGKALKRSKKIQNYDEKTDETLSVNQHRLVCMLKGLVYRHQLYHNKKAKNEFYRLKHKAKNTKTSDIYEKGRRDWFKLHQERALPTYPDSRMYELLKNNLEAEELGIPESTSLWHRKMVSSHGETINSLEYHLSRVEALRKRKNLTTLHKVTTCGSIRLQRWLKGDYSPMPLQENNQRLPRWLKCEIRDQTIVFSGTPTEEDRDEYLLQIRGSSGFMLREFGLEVKTPDEISRQTSIGLQDMSKNSLMAERRRSSFGEKVGLKTLQSSALFKGMKLLLPSINSGKEASKAPKSSIDRVFKRQKKLKDVEHERMNEDVTVNINDETTLDDSKRAIVVDRTKSYRWTPMDEDTGTSPGKKGVNSSISDNEEVKPLNIGGLNWGSLLQEPEKGEGEKKTTKIGEEKNAESSHSGKDISPKLGEEEDLGIENLEEQFDLGYGDEGSSDPKRKLLSS